VARVHPRVDPMMRPIINRCDPRGTALDVGAWFGPWTFWLSRQVDQVRSFEPNPEVAEVLRRSVRPNVTVHEVAASDRNAHTVLHLPPGGRGGEGVASLESTLADGRSVDVSTIRIDDLGIDDTRFMKVDVEGHEMAALSGAIATIDRSHPILLVELEERFGHLDEIVTLLTGLGYRGHVHVNGRWSPLDVSWLADHQRSYLAEREPASYLASAVRPTSYVNNVAWVHPASTWLPW
jgi:FkbM family methyltransferase